MNSKGALFENTTKSTDNQPDVTGMLDHDGKKYELAGWHGEKNGRTLTRIKVECDRQECGSGFLGKNDYKERDGQPDFTGKIDIDGGSFRIAAWNNVSKKGQPYMGITVSEPRQPAAASSTTESETPF